MFCFQLLSRRSLKPIRFFSTSLRQSYFHCVNGIVANGVVARRTHPRGLMLGVLCLRANPYCTDAKCWNCGTSDDSSSLVVNFCRSCHLIQPLSKKLSFFEILGIEEAFNINRKDVIAAYRRLQGFFHPDRYSNAGEKEKEIAAVNSATVNDAYHTLIHPVERSLYFLILHHRPLEEGEITMDPKFLMEIMEINERLAEAEDKETVIEIAQVNNKIMDKLLSETSEAFSKKEIDAARILVAKIKYYNNIYEKIKQLELKFHIMH